MFSIYSFQVSLYCLYLITYYIKEVYSFVSKTFIINFLQHFIFYRDDFSPKFVALFSLLLFLKSFHWLAEDRVDYMERSPSISLLFHIR